MDFTVYAALNLLIDLVLIFALASSVPRRLPRIFAAVVVLSLGQHLVQLPLNEIPGLRSGTPDAPGRLGGWIDRLQEARHSLSEGESFPAPRLGLPDLHNLFSNPAATLSPHTPPTDAEPAPAPPHRQSLGQRWWNDLWSDPHALWLGVRIFWLASALLLMMQRPALGADALAFQLLPLPFLSLAIPYTYHWLQNYPWVRAINGALRDPVRAWDYLTPERMGLTVLVFAFILLLLVGITIMILARKVSPVAALRRKFLNPGRYMVRINGSLHPFAVSGNKLLVQDFVLDCTHFAVMPGRDHVWRLRSSTTLEFVEKDPAD